jgi:small basic protein
MPIVTIIIVLIVVGLLIGVVTRLPMPEFWRNLIIAVAAIGTIIWLLSATGLLHYVTSIKI